MNQPDAWRCALCGEHYVTPSLARECERHHEALTKETPK